MWEKVSKKDKNQLYYLLSQVISGDTFMCKWTRSKLSESIKAWWGNHIPDFHEEEFHLPMESACEK